MPGRPVLTRVFRLPWLLACLLCLGQAGRPLHMAAQDPRFLRHGNWSTENGLPQNSVHQVLQTKDGFLWVATEGGIARFDGVAFTTFNHEADPAFVSNDTCCLAEAPSGDLWIGTSDGLLRLRLGVFQRFSQKDGLPSAAILGLHTTTGGHLRVQTASGTAEQDGTRFIPSTTKPVDDPGAFDPPAETRRGTLWSMSSTTVTLTTPGHTRVWNAPGDLPGGRVESLFVDRQGNAWVGTNTGLALIRDGAGQAQSIPALLGNSVLQTYQDREGNYWIATETTGLHLLHAEVFRNEPALADQALTAVVQGTNGDVWVGTRNDGLHRLRGGHVDTPVRPSALTSPIILSLAPGRHEDLWAGTPDGLNHVDAAGNVVQVTSADTLPDDYIRALAAGSDGTLWVGTRKGLVRLQGGRTKVFTRADGLGSDVIGALLSDRHGDVWVGTSGGLSRLAADGHFIAYGGLDDRASPIVSALAESPSGVLWIATRDGMLSRLKEDRILPVESASLHAGPITALLADRAGFLWMRGEHTIQRAAVADLDACAGGGAGCSVSVHRYGASDGMPSSESVPGGSPLLWQMQDGDVWAATRKGVAIAADDPPSSPQPFPVVIERMLVNGSEQGLQHGSVKLQPGADRVDIEYAGLSYAAPLQVTYRYRLEGFDRDWTRAGTRRMATYTNLPARSYIFRVEARASDGAWLGVPATQSFRVMPPVFRRWWFLLLALLLAAGAIVALYRLRLRWLQQQFEAVLGERNRMARAIHDTLAQDFVGVALQLDLVAQCLASGRPEAATQQVKSARKLVTDGLAEARRSIWDLRANAGDNSLPTRLAALVERYSGPSLTITLQVGGAYRRLTARTEEDVVRIAQEALSNVQRHSGATEATLQLHFGTDMLVMIVTDQGRGFIAGERAVTHGHFGVSGMSERATAMGATLLLVSEPGKGTTVTLRANVTADETRRA